MPSYILKKRVFKEGETVTVPTGKTIQPILVLKIEWGEDGIPQTGLEIWYVEVSP